MLFGESTCHFHYARQGCGFVIGQVSQYWDQRALAVEELGVPHQRVVDLRPNHAFVVTDGVPLRATLKTARSVGTYRIGE
ncbi:hypothetical protein D9M69_637640 [compost metagenome]